MPALDPLFRAFVAGGGSDLHLCEGRRPRSRVHGVLEDMSTPPLDGPQLQTMMEELVDEERWRRFVDSGDLDFAYELPGLARFRGNFHRNHYGVGAVFRRISDEIIPLHKLDLPEVLPTLTRREGGLFLVTGPTGSGKSTTLASLLDYVNTNEERHMILIEDPIEFVHTAKKAFITQREIGTHARTFAQALRAAVRQDPDVIMVGEMRDLETVSLALTAAEMGFLVFGTLHTNSAAKTIDRLVDIFPSHQQGMVREQIAASLVCVVSQILLRTRGGKGRVAACDTLVANQSLRKLITSGNTHQIASFVQQNRKLGCQSMDDAIIGHVQAGRVARDDVIHYLRDPKALQRL